MHSRNRVFRRLLTFAFLLAGLGPARALTFNFTAAPGMSSQAIQGFQDAASLWSSWLADAITVNLDIDFTALSPGVLGSTGSTEGTVSYAGFRTAVTADVSSGDDAAFAASLGAGGSFDLLLNYTSNSPNGSGSPTTFLDSDGDANNSTVRMNYANARALGLAPAVDGVSDGGISFSTLFTWDFDRGNGITPGAFDFVGVAAHEIGHALGFVSGVDILDLNSTGSFFPDHVFTYVAPLDFTRFSAASIAAGGAGTLDWTAGTSAKYFSIDGGVTSLGATFSTGTEHGDGRQASHWKDNLGLGIMDPTAAPGELINIGNFDLRAFDVIGFNRAASYVPEPQTAALTLLGGFLLRSLRGRLRFGEDGKPTRATRRREPRRRHGRRSF